MNSGTTVYYAHDVNIPSGEEHSYEHVDLDLPQAYSLMCS